MEEPPHARLARIVSNHLLDCKLEIKPSLFRDDVAFLLDTVEQMMDALERLRQWADAYPLDVFPEPDFAKAHELLRAAISASCMRHVVEGVGKIAREALGVAEPTR